MGLLIGVLLEERAFGVAGPVLPHSEPVLSNIGVQLQRLDAYEKQCMRDAIRSRTLKVSMQGILDGINIV